MTTFWTVGHSTHSESEFVSLLNANGIECLADIRSIPGSNKHPQFNRESMASWLADAGIRYEHIGRLGGRRNRQRQISPDVNAGWTNHSFKNYADYTLTHEFMEGLFKLEKLANQYRTAYMCSEWTPAKCHRLILSNVLVARGGTVIHIGATGHGTLIPKFHELGMYGATPEIRNGCVVYPRVKGDNAEH